MRVSPGWEYRHSRFAQKGLAVSEPGAVATGHCGNLGVMLSLMLIFAQFQYLNI
jgi:hypothetical protein